MLNFWFYFPYTLPCTILNEKIVLLLISQPVKAEAVYYVLACVLSSGVAIILFSIFHVTWEITLSLLLNIHYGLTLTDMLLSIRYCKTTNKLLLILCADRIMYMYRTEEKNCPGFWISFHIISIVPRTLQTKEKLDKQLLVKFWWFCMELRMCIAHFIAIL